MAIDKGPHADKIGPMRADLRFVDGIAFDVKDQVGLMEYTAEMGLKDCHEADQNLWDEEFTSIRNW